jgi:hypothetical protein
MNTEHPEEIPPEPLRDGAGVMCLIAIGAFVTAVTFTGFAIYGAVCFFRTL